MRRGAGDAAGGDGAAGASGPSGAGGAASGDGVARGDGSAAGAGEGVAAGGVALGAGLAARGVACGEGDAEAGARIGSACGGVATARSGAGDRPAGGAAAGSRFVMYEIAAPIPNPARMTKIITGMRGKLDSLRRLGGGIRLRIARSFARERRGASHLRSAAQRQEARPRPRKGGT